MENTKLIAILFGLRYFISSLMKKDYKDFLVENTRIDSHVKNELVDILTNESKKHNVYLAEKVVMGNVNNDNDCGKPESIFNKLQNAKVERAMEPVQLSKFHFNEVGNDNQNIKCINELFCLIKSDLQEEMSTEILSKKLFAYLEEFGASISFSTAKNSNDISLLDYVKSLTIALCCVEEYLNENPNDNFNNCSFMICNIDISDHKPFYFKGMNQNGVAGVRERWMYFEILREYMTDKLLNSLGLDRRFLIFSGGKHSYIICPNTNSNVEAIECYKKECRSWFLETFKTELFLSVAYRTINISEIEIIDFTSSKFKPKYMKIFGDAAEENNKRNKNRYVLQELKQISDNKVNTDFDGILFETNKAFASAKYDSAFVILTKKCDMKMCLPIGPSRYILIINEHETLMNDLLPYVETVYIHYKGDMFKYINNGIFPNRLWYITTLYANKVSDYVNCDEKSFIAALRIDLDNSRKTLMEGYISDKSNLQTAARTLSYSRNLAMFMKSSIDELIRDVVYTKDYKCDLIYLGADDIFMLGDWMDVVKVACELNNIYIRYLQGALTISAGLAIGNANNSIDVMAIKADDLLWTAKANPGKNTLAINNKQCIYKWNELEKSYINESDSMISSSLIEGLV